MFELQQTITNERGLQSLLNNLHVNGKIKTLECVLHHHQEILALRVKLFNTLQQMRESSGVPIKDDSVCEYIQHTDRNCCVASENWIKDSDAVSWPSSYGADISENIALTP